MTVINKVEMRFLIRISPYIKDEYRIKTIMERLYYLKTNQRFRFKNAKKYTEKLQLYKFWLKNKDFEKYTAKIRVREWIGQVLGEDYLIPVYKVWDSTDEITLDDLPEEFVIKTNHGAGMNLVVNKKDDLDVKDLCKKSKGWLSKNFCYCNGFEYQYEKITPLLYAEKKIANKEGELPEYKFLCFDGIPYFCMVDLDRFGKHKRNIYDLNWNLQDWNIGKFSNSDVPVAKPNNFESLVCVAQKLAKGFKHVRVDLYDVDEKIYFSEMTFTTGSGYSLPVPDEANKYLGKLFNI